MHARKKQKGRPRKTHLVVDKGTKELQKKRAVLLGTNLGKDSFLAESLLGIFYGRQLITRPLYEAGVFFGELGYRYEPCLGHKFRQNSSSLFSNKIDYQGSSPFFWSDADVEKRALAWHKALQVLKQAGAGPYKIVCEVVFYDQDLYTTLFPEYLHTFAKPLCTGLKSLECYFKGEWQGGRGKRFDPGLNPERSTRFQLPLKVPQSYPPA